MSVGIPAYNEGAGIVHTLESLAQSLAALELQDAPVLLSDSSETTSTVDAARGCARDHGMRLLIDRSEHRRTAKEARNVLMAWANTDILVQIDADVTLPTGSLAHLLRCLTERPRPLVALGTAAADPSFPGKNHRAGAWQLSVVRRYTSWLPDDAVRAEAACWGAWRSFYKHYEFPVGIDSPVDDVCLSRHIVASNIHARNCWRAVVHKVPPATLNDFFLQTQRGYAASGPYRRGLRELGAAVVEAAKDPLGASLYVHARIWAAREQRRRQTEWKEEWDVTHSTKRR